MHGSHPRRRRVRHLISPVLAVALGSGFLMASGQTWAQADPAPSPHTTPGGSSSSSPAPAKPGTAGSSTAAKQSPRQQLVNTPATSPEHKTATDAMTAATKQAKATGKPVPVDAQTTIYSTTLANPDGSFTSTENIAPQRVKQNGAWAPVNTTLVKAADGSWHTTASVFGITISGGGNSPLAVEDDHQGHVLSIAWPSPLPKPQIHADTALYPAILPGVDLKLTADAYGVSDVLIVHDAEAAANPALAALQMKISGAGLTVAATSSGGLTANDTTGKPRFTGSTPMMWDSATTSSAPANSKLQNPAADATAGTSQGSPDMSVQPAPTSHLARMPLSVAGSAVDIHPDHGMLTAATTVYPVYLDPNITPVYSNERAEIWQCGDTEYINGQGETGTQTLRVGWNSCGGLIRGMLQFDSTQLWAVEDIPTDIDWANITLTNQYQCTPVTPYATGNIQSGVTWSNQGGKSIWTGGGAGPIAGQAMNCPTNNTGQQFVISDLAQARNAASNDWSTITIGLQASNEANHSTSNYLAYYASGGTAPTLTAHWWASPTVASFSVDTAPIGNHGARSQICGSNSWTNAGYLPITSTPPTLHMGVTDQDAGHNLVLGYDLNAGIGNDATPATGWSETQPYTVANSLKTFDLPLSYNFVDGQEYAVIPYAGDPLTGVTYDPGGVGPNGAAGGIACMFIAALTPPGQPKERSTTYQPTGQHLASYPTVGHGGSVTVEATAPTTPIVRFDWALNTASTNEGTGNCSLAGNNCGSVPVTSSLDAIATITIPAGTGNGEHWGNNYIYYTAIDAAGNVSEYGRFDFFEAQAFQPVSFGNVTGDGTPNLMASDPAGNLIVYPANQDMTASANAIQVAPATAAPNGKSWSTALYTHRGAERVQPTDDLFAWDKTGDGTGHLYYYYNTQTASASTQPGYVPPGTVNAYTQTQQALITRPTCTPSALNGWCIGYNQSSWNDVKQVLALGPVSGGCTIKTPTVACKTNLITVESNGVDPARVWMFSPAGVGQLRNPVLLSTSVQGWDWANVELIAPGNATNHPGGAGGMPDLWAFNKTTHSLWQFTNHSDTGLPGSGLGDLSTKTPLGSPGEFSNYDWVSSVGDLNGDGNPDLWLMNKGRLDVLFGPFSSTIDLNAQGQSTATTTDWSSSTPVSSLQGTAVAAGSTGQIISDVIGGPAGQLCIDDHRGIQTNGAVVDVYECNGTGPQAWTFEADNTIRTVGPTPPGPSNMCLDTGGATIQGAPIILNTCNSTQTINSPQQWRTIPAPGVAGRYWIYNPSAGMCLDDTNYSTTDGTQFQLWPCTDSAGQPNPAQRFTLPAEQGAQQQIEAENLHAPWSSNSGGTMSIQANCCGVTWSNGAQQMLVNSAAGSTMTLNYNVAYAGLYQVTPVMTKAADYGQVTLTIDSSPLPLPATFDGWQASGVSTTPFPFGTVNLTAGSHSFVFTVTGTNSASTANRYNMGIDVLNLIPATTAGPNTALNVPTTGIVNQPVTADASATFPGTARITGYTFDFGDGTVVGPQAGPTANHAYTTAGTYPVKVTVTDSNNVNATTNSKVTVLSSPAIPNGDFETGDLSGWTASYNSGITTTNPHGGTYAGQINAPANGNGSIEQVVNGLAPNTSYTLTGWIRTDGGTTILGTKDYDADPGDDTGDSTTATAWTQLSSQFTTGATNTSVDIYCYRPTAGTSACDDFTLVANPAPGAAANPDFETGNLAGWNVSNHAGVTTTNPHGGTYAGQINAPTGGNGSIEQVVTGLIPNTAYTLSGWIRTDGGTTTLGAKQFDVAGDKQEATTTNTAWTQLTDQFTTGVSNTSVDIYCNRATAGTSACDDFALTPTPATVPNHDFESGNLAGWTASYNAGVTTTNPHTGTYAGQINAPTGGNGSIEQVVTGLTPNTTYTLTGWVRTDGGATILGTKFFDADPDDDTGDSTTATGWTQLTSQFTTGPTNTTVDIYCYRSTAGTSACDDFTLTAN